MAIFVDADACPVRGEVERVATRHKARVFVVSNGGIRPSQTPMVETVIVSDGPDVADDWIAGRAGSGDTVVTADIPLAARVVASGALAIKPDGEILDARTIGGAVAVRDLMTDLRAADPFRQGGSKPFTKADRSRFLNALETCMRRTADRQS
ncbi:MAG: YaiI/YqxD family protein [Pseudomonadota bacterium]